MHYIFDFDGTIVDSFDYVLGFLSKEAGRKKPIGAEADKYRSMSMKDVGLALGVPYWRLLFLYFKGRRVMREHMDNLLAFEGMKDVIKKLHDDGHKLYIISSNSGKNIKRFLIKNDMTQYFWAVRGGAGILGKVNLIRQLKRRFKIHEPIIYVGDEVRDIVSAKASGVQSAAVTWGFANPDSLKELDPDYLVDKPKDLLKIT